MSEIVKQEKVKRAKWNTDVVDGLSAEYGFEVWKCSENHFRLFHPKRGPLNYWPSTNRANWDKGKSFDIPDIEAYLMKHFNPSPPPQKSATNLIQRIDQLEKVLRDIQEQVIPLIIPQLVDGSVGAQMCFEADRIITNALTHKTSTDE